MQSKWIFWLIRILIYTGVVIILILVYQQNEINCEPCLPGLDCPPCPLSSTQSTVLLIGKIFGVAVIAIELLFVLRGAMKRKRAN